MVWFFGFYGPPVISVGFYFPLLGKLVLIPLGSPTPTPTTGGGGGGGGGGGFGTGGGGGGGAPPPPPATVPLKVIPCIVS